ncbi:solute carrier family 25 (mitochondrial ornithine transporter) member 2/15 [Paragonimus westermani]|uniref:Solute carrier family 25 (Mitochondrial ornithine transporter) member 2/15 n=1 Tax=Paragonimus westermani TaxID=34504 RepID=A0A5J4N7K2_9TREM|nr:solute carrier family 25 (mitochondrial ornithine transporter) member 2/15 [Paragonimus westermani]
MGLGKVTQETRPQILDLYPLERRRYHSAFTFTHFLRVGLVEHFLVLANDGSRRGQATTSGGIATVYVGQPLDTIKVKMQAFPEVYSNAWKCFKITWAKDGIARGLYAGTSPALVANVAENSVLFCALPPCQHIIGRMCGKNPGDHLSDIQHACAGSLAAFWSSLTLCPTELVKCKVQSMREMAELGQIKLSPSEL